MSNQAIVNTSAFTNVILGFINLETPRAFGNQKETYSVTAYFDKAKYDALKKAGFKVKEPTINPVTNEKEFSMELRAKLGHKPTVRNDKKELIEPSLIANGTKANLKVAVRDDLRNPGKVVTTLLAVKATEIVNPVDYITQAMLDEADNSPF